MLKKSINWIGAATTAAAVLEHAAFDYRKKGSVDPEVLTLGLLVNSIVNNKKILGPSALTWISTFGRHFSSHDNEGILLEVVKKKEDRKKAYYHLNVSKLNSKIFAQLCATSAQLCVILNNSNSILSRHRVNP